MKNIIALLIILALLGAATAYIVRAKRKGSRCIGCPAADCCCTNKNNNPQSSACASVKEDKPSKP